MAVAATWAMPAGAVAGHPTGSRWREGCPGAPIELNRRIELGVTLYCARRFTVRGSNGYSITVSAEPPPGRRRGLVEVTAERHDTDVIYLGKGTFTATGMKASFGHLGRLSMRFHSSGKVRRVEVPRGCLKERPKVVTARLGAFVGTFRFRGERDYTAVSAHHARGGIGDPLAIKGGKPECESHPSAARKKQELESVELNASNEQAGTGFSALPSAALLSSAGFAQPGGVDQAAFLAMQSEKRRNLSILRFVGAAGSSDAFSFDDALTMATVTPPPPFTGTGAFQRNADGSTSWSGSLSVPMPGLGTVSLTGPGYQSELATLAEYEKQREEEFGR